MELNLNRIVSDRLLFDGSTFRKANGFWDWCLRIISWIWSPSCYSEENRKTVACFRKYLVEELGSLRLQKICARYAIDLDAMEKGGGPLLSRDVAKIKVGIEDVRIEDVEAFAGCPDRLSGPALAKAVDALARPLGQLHLPELGEIRGGKPTEILAYFFFDRFLADRERLALQKENRSDDFETFVHNFAARIMRRELEVGMLVPAPDQNGKRRFYRVGGKLVTGEGMVSYWLIPMAKAAGLAPIRFYRGTAPRISELDASSSLITDLESEIGQSAWKSAEPYAPLIKTLLPKTPTVAGHSLGATLSQDDLVENGEIKTAYLFNGPGVSEEKAMAFNRRMARRESRPVEMHIRDCHLDHYCTAGRVRLGYQSSGKVRMFYRKYFPPRTLGSAGRVHTTVWSRQNRIYGIEGGLSREEIDARLRPAFGAREWIRETFGPCLSRLIRLVRDCIRWLFGSRAQEQKGLHVGSFEGAHWLWGGGKWTVRHIRGAAG